MPGKNVPASGNLDEVDLAAVSPVAPVLEPAVTLFDPRCRPLADVSRSFAAELTMQGTGRLRDGRIVNVWGGCSCADRSMCFKVTGRQWGNAGTGRPLAPFRTVAVDPRLIKLGSLLYIPELD